MGLRGIGALHMRLGLKTGVHLNHFFVAASYLKKSCGPLVAIYRLRGANRDLMGVVTLLGTPSLLMAIFWPEIPPQTGG
jgi:hypothetical protein